MPKQPKISVMYLTNRYGGVDILWANMLRQDFEDWELVIVDGLWRDREGEVKAYINDPRLVYVRQSDKREGAHTNLAHADNDGFRACSGELIVCLQDYIWIPYDSLSKYWFHYQQLGNCLVTGVGHQYSSPDKEKIANAKGAITVFDSPFKGRPEVIGWQDPRMRGASFRECAPVEWEMNWCSIPRSVIYELGGMDEQYDFEGFAWDNTNIAERAVMLGYKCYIDQTLECRALMHDDWWPNPLKVQRVSPAKYHYRKMDEMRRTSPILNYLK